MSIVKTVLDLRVRQGAGLKLPSIWRVAETKARVSSQNSTYSGTVRNVPGTYATLTAAYTAAANGDIIQLADGTYNLASESGGYWLVNTSTKGVLVRGNAANPSSVVLTCSSAAYGIRLRDCAAMTFQDLTIESTGSAKAIYQDQPYSSRWVKFKNCILNKSTTATWIFERTSLTSDTNAVWIEFDNCTFNVAVNYNPIQYLNSGVNETLLIKGCIFNKTDSTGTYMNLIYTSVHKGKIVVYDSTFNAVTSNPIVRFGEDEGVPTNTTFQVDFRGNTILYTSTNVGHAVLFGRGTNKVYAVNNTVTIPAVNNSMAIGFVIKTTASSQGDAYFGGNKIIAPRPILIKGGQKCLLRYNTLIENISLYGALNVNNPEASRLSILNHVKLNNIIGLYAAINAIDTVAVEDADVTMQGWAVDNNNYYSAADRWAVKADLSVHYFQTKNTFWSGSQDTNSKLLSKSTIGIEQIITDDIVLN